MIQKHKNGVSWLEFELIADAKLKHGVFLSPLNSRQSDHAKSILDIPALVSGRQCHGKDVGIITHENDNPVCDALVTQLPHIGLTIRHADCQAGILYDPINHAVANVHSGWRGSVQNIYSGTISYMRRCFGSDPKNILVAISPSLGPENAEFIHYRQELPEYFWEFQTKPNYFDFWAISRWQLISSGIASHHIQIAEIDTYSDHERFFSYRRNRTEERNCTIVALSHAS
jgi:YfiH family protein